MVALRKESVDRNIRSAGRKAGIRKSLSARRAWIEILVIFSNTNSRYVALRKESVDRNTERSCKGIIENTSLSARRAWIEIF